MAVFGAATLRGGLSTVMAADEPFKAAWVYVGPVTDQGWTASHDAGRLAVAEAFPEVETSYLESVPENPADAERVIRDFAQKGNKLIFTCSFGFMDPTINVAAEFPDTTFIHISGYKTAENVGTAFGKVEEPRYVSGLIAGQMTKTNKLGYVAAFPIPEVIRGINSFTRGVREVNPEATVKVVWTSTWFDPVKERQAADALLDDGADVTAQHQDSTATIQAAADRGLLSVGYDFDQTANFPETVLTSPLFVWGPFYVETVKAVMDGTWVSSQVWGGWKDGMVDLATIGAMVPAEVAAAAAAEADLFKSGEKTITTIFTGPIKDNAGEEKVAEGAAMTDEELLGMSWFVEGVDGEIPS